MIVIVCGTILEGTNLWNKRLHPRDVVQKCSVRFPDCPFVTHFSRIVKLGVGSERELSCPG